MSSVNSTKSYILLFANFDSLSNMAIFYQFRGISYSQIDAFPTQTYTHTHTKKNPKAVVSYIPVLFGIRSFFFFWVFRKFRFRARGSSFLTDFGVLHTSWFGFAFDRFTSSGFSVFDWVTGISFSTSWFIAFREFEYLVPYKLECFLLKSLLLSASFQNNQNLTYLVMECIFFSGIFSGRRSLIPRDSW